MFKNRTHYLVAVAILVFSIILLVNFYRSRKDETANNSLSEINVGNFTECRDAGYPTNSTYPRICSTPDGVIYVEDLSPSTGTSSPEATSSSSEITYKDLIKVSNLKTGDTIKSPLHIEGEARGQWYFEATFSIKITDMAGNVMGTGNAQAKGDWMTTSYVPFISDISFTNQKGATLGYVVFQKDNPSGKPENDDSLKIGVRFTPL